MVNKCAKKKEEAQEACKSLLVDEDQCKESCPKVDAEKVCKGNKALIPKEEALTKFNESLKKIEWGCNTDSHFIGKSIDDGFNTNIRCTPKSGTVDTSYFKESTIPVKPINTPNIPFTRISNNEPVKLEESGFNYPRLVGTDVQAQREAYNTQSSLNKGVKTKTSIIPNPIEIKKITLKMNKKEKLNYLTDIEEFKNLQRDEIEPLEKKLNEYPIIPREHNEFQKQLNKLNEKASKLQEKISNPIISKPKP